MKYILKNSFPLAGVVPAALLTLGSGNLYCSGRNSKAPNIICILLDDISAIEFNVYNGPGINTPVIDKIAKDGVIFGTAWSQPLCGPSRATLLTGKYAHKNLHYSNSVFPETSIFSSHYTLGKAMKDAGYNTAWFGKQHIDRHLNPSDFGFDYYVVAKYWDGYDGPAQGLEPVSTGRKGMYGAQWYRHPGLVANGKGIPTGTDDFGPKIELDSILAYIGNKTDKPFFIHWPTNLPHHEYVGATKSWERPDIPEFDKSGKWTGRRIEGSMKSNIEYIDFALGKIMDKLKETNEIDNTIIFIMGDNGTAGYGKGKPESEIAVHVPFIVYGPKIIKVKGMSDVLTDISDFLPTFIDLAGFKTKQTKEMDGHSLAPYLLGKGFHPRQWISAQLDSARWLRTREWLLDGKGDLWYCGKEFDERKFINMSKSEDREAINKRKELQKLLDENIHLQ